MPQPSIVLLFLGLCLNLSNGNEDVSNTNNTYRRHEVQLIEDLISRAHKVARPVKQPNDTITVYFGLVLLSLDDVNEKDRTITTSVWMRQYWKDAFLTWNPEDYGGIQMVRLPISSIWSADLIVYNSKTKFVPSSDALAVVSSSGTVLWIPPTHLTSRCSFDMMYFPFDEQQCSIKIASWTYDGFQVDLKFYDGMSAVDVSDYHMDNNEWALIGNPAVRNVKYYPCCQEPYPDLIFTLRIRRMPRYYRYIYLGPAVLLALLAPFVFLLPPGDSQKLTLGGGLLICFTLLISRSGDLLPRANSNIPLIDMYYISQYVLLSLSIAMTTVVANIAKQATSMKRPPAILQKILLSGLGRCLCVSYNSYAEPPLIGDSAADGILAEDGDGTKGRPPSKREWLLMATVIDRLFFLIHLLLMVVMTLWILLRRP